MSKIKYSTILSVYKKIAMFTDIHFGVRNNELLHLQDCIDFINFFVEQIKNNECDCIIFLGDWFENRNALNVQTINYSLIALRILNSLNIPVYFIVGNHDLYFRNNRNFHSIEIFREFKNIIIVDEPLSLGKFLILPFLFKDEYPSIASEINQHKFVFGHFEFKNFYLTGSSNQVCEHGFLHKLLSGPKYIFSGHFHKRQALDNIIYIGNPFATNYGDVNDDARGMCILDVDEELVDFIDYEGPSYQKTNLSKILAEEVKIRNKSRIKCLLDIDISYSEAQSIKNELMECYELREFSLEENLKELQEAIAESALKEIDDMDLNSIDESIANMILEGVQPINGIDPTKLVKIYTEL